MFLTLSARRRQLSSLSSPRLSKKNNPVGLASQLELRRCQSTTATLRSQFSNQFSSALSSCPSNGDSKNCLRRVPLRSISSYSACSSSMRNPSIHLGVKMFPSKKKIDFFSSFSKSLLNQQAPPEQQQNISSSVSEQHTPSPPAESQQDFSKNLQLKISKDKIVQEFNKSMQQQQQQGAGSEQEGKGIWSKKGANVFIIHF